MRRRRIQIIIIFFNVFAVVALVIGQAEESLFEPIILAIPQTQREAELRLIVADSGDTILAPPIGPRHGLLVRKIIPAIAISAIILANRSLLTFAEVRPPQQPILFPLPVFIQTQMLWTWTIFTFSTAALEDTPWW